MPLFSSSDPVLKFGRSLLVFSCGVGAVFLFGGCVTRAPQPVAAAQSYDKIILTDGQYEYVTVTGSNIPVLASKNPIARTEPQTASPVVTMSPDAFRRMMERAASSNR